MDVPNSFQLDEIPQLFYQIIKSLGQEEVKKILCNVAQTNKIACINHYPIGKPDDYIINYDSQYNGQYVLKSNKIGHILSMRNCALYLAQHFNVVTDDQVERCYYIFDLLVRKASMTEMCYSDSDRVDVFWEPTCISNQKSLIYSLFGRPKLYICCVDPNHDDNAIEKAKFLIDLILNEEEFQIFNTFWSSIDDIII
jgi:hypothetical protein